jgi:hypothetical protein
MDSRRLDAIVAEKVMGWTVERAQIPTYPRGGIPHVSVRTVYTVTRPDGSQWSPVYDLDITDLPRYSTNIADAWKVVEKMRDDGWHPAVEWELNQWECTMWHVAYESGYARSDSAPEAICMAVLKAKGVGIAQGG